MRRSQSEFMQMARASVATESPSGKSPARHPRFKLASSPFAAG
jgi:hypothetical protein